MNLKNSENEKCGFKSDQLCWTCKRIRNCAGCTCPWASKHEPVPGWTAEPGIYIDVPTGEKDENGVAEMETVRSWAVKECPMYIQNHKYTTPKEVFQAIANYFGKSFASIKTNPRVWTLRYLDEKVEELPKWYMFYIYNGSKDGDGEE